MWGLLAQAEPSISESSRRGQNESHPLPWDTGNSAGFFFQESPWPVLHEILVNLGLSERPPGGNTHTMLLTNRQTGHLFELQLEEN